MPTLRQLVGPPGSSPRLYPTPQLGGGGATFDDEAAIASFGQKIAGITHIFVWANPGSFPVGLQVVYRTASGSQLSPPVRGSASGAKTAIEDPSGLNVVSIAVGAGPAGGVDDVIRRLVLVVAQPDGTWHTYDFGDRAHATNAVYKGRLLGFLGRSGAFLDRLGFYLDAPTSPLSGSAPPNAVGFSDPVLDHEPPVVEIDSISLWYGIRAVVGMQLAYRLADSSIKTLPVRGTSHEGTHAVIRFEPGEQILALVGRAGARIDQLGFLTVRGNGERTTYGPYGSATGGVPFIRNADVLGFFGAAQDGVLSALGVYQRPIDVAADVAGSPGAG
jgi:hypothetical protein